MNSLGRTLVLIVATFAFLPGAWSAAKSAPTRAPTASPPGGLPDDQVELSVRNEALRSIGLALTFLREHQAADGSWGRGYPAVTALGATAFLRSPIEPTPENRGATDLALKYLVASVKADGGIYPKDPPQMEAYNTSICLMALTAAGDPRFDEIIRNARRFLISLQADERRGYTPDSAHYGGIGYGGDGRPDLSNLQWSLEALKASQGFAPRSEAESSPVDEGSTVTQGTVRGESRQGLFWDKAILFLQRCQNLRESNDQAWSGNDGGFIYNPSESKAGDFTSYGSMTYAGMKSFIYAGVKRDDPRVRAATEWCRRNYTLELNPGMGMQGYYYYLHTLAKAMNAHGEGAVVDAGGKAHDWREELIVKLVSLQRQDGSWVNSVGRWWENQPELVTAYCVLALEEALGHGIMADAGRPAGASKR